MSNKQHTPTPWIQDTHSDNNDIVLRAMDGTITANCSVDYSESWKGERDKTEVAANAALIVRAVNNHEAALEALRNAHAFMCHHVNGFGQSTSAIEMRKLISRMEATE